MHGPRDRPVEPDPGRTDEHAYEDTRYRALKAHSEHLQNEPPPPDEDDPAEDG